MQRGFGSACHSVPDGNFCPSALKHFNHSQVSLSGAEAKVRHGDAAVNGTCNEQRRRTAPVTLKVYGGRLVTLSASNLYYKFAA